MHPTEQMDALSPLMGRTLVLIAHPDDETISCGALLQRMRKPLVVFATDGGPQDEFFWGRHGSREKYVEIRKAEARAALEAVGVTDVRWLIDSEGHAFQDQRLFRHLPAAARALAQLVQETEPEALLSLAYEGGHPDHDSCGFLAKQVGNDFGIPVWEAPLYFRRGAENVLLQEFREKNGTEVELIPTEEEQQRKRKMCEAYVSQRGVVAIFENNDRERFRPMAEYDYSRPPHEGVLNYEAWQWPIKGQEVADKFQEFLQARQRAERAS